MNLLQIANLTENQAREHIEKVIWPDNKPVCPHCNNKQNNYQLKGKSHRPGLYCCKQCRKQFTVTVNTIMERSKIPLKKWLMAYYLVCSSKKGISSLQLARQLDITQKTAWFMEHRIRASMEVSPLAGKLTGTVEVDETYVGGKPRKGKGKEPAKRGRGTKKIPVVVLVQRNGDARSYSVEKVDSKTLKQAVRDNVDKKSRVITDEWKSYKGLDKEFSGGHDIISHGDGVYSIGDVHVNTAESFFALLKRGVYGVFHHVSKEHLDRYCDEFAFRWNHRDVTDGERTNAAIKMISGKRLVYKDMKDK